MPIGATVVLVSAGNMLNETTIERLAEIRRRGCVVHLALTGDADSKIGAETYDLPVHHLGGRDVWHELVQHAGDEQSGIPGQSSTPLLVN